MVQLESLRQLERGGTAGGGLGVCCWGREGAGRWGRGPCLGSHTPACESRGLTAQTGWAYTRKTLDGLGKMFSKLPSSTSFLDPGIEFTYVKKK